MDYQEITELNNGEIDACFGGNFLSDVANAAVAAARELLASLAGPNA